MSDKEKWLDGELWNFVRGAAIDLEIPLKSPAEEQLCWHMKQACGVYANVLAGECRTPAPQPAEGCSECHPTHNTICLCKCHDDGTSSALQPDLELLLRELRSKEDALIAMEKAATDMLLHDGGEGSLNYDAHAYRESRRHLQSLANISCDKCGETLPHLYDENCTDYREAATPQVTPTECEFLRQQVERLEKRIAAHDYPEENARMGCNNLATPQVTPTPDIELVMALQRADEMARVIDDWTERGELNTRSALADARLNYGRPFQYKWTIEGTSEQASPTPEKCPSCGSRHTWAHDQHRCPDSWHSSAATQKGKD